MHTRICSNVSTSDLYLFLTVLPVAADLSPPSKLKLHFSVAVSCIPHHLYITDVSSASVCVFCVILIWITGRQQKHRLLFRTGVRCFLLPICQTHHLWQKIHCLVSLHLTVTLATTAEVNCQLGQSTSVGCVPSSCSPQTCNRMLVAGLICKKGNHTEMQSPCLQV